ncbi:MAG: helix-turn-helix domain-containing protein, partial [Candidatus Methanoculleus thermohydrogenotrophicum]|nr:helix-turn-helix domain-containing protein [Candidatus Methanoculleus thermohydrogenotrophicum]
MWDECRPQIHLLDIRSYNKAMRKTYRYRLSPTKAQVTLLEKTLGGMP